MKKEKVLSTVESFFFDEVAEVPELLVTLLFVFLVKVEVFEVETVADSELVLELVSAAVLSVSLGRSVVSLLSDFVSLNLLLNPPKVFPLELLRSQLALGQAFGVAEQLLPSFFPEKLRVVVLFLLLAEDDVGAAVVLGPVLWLAVVLNKHALHVSEAL